MLCGDRQSQTAKLGKRRVLELAKAFFQGQAVLSKSLFLTLGIFSIEERELPGLEYDGHARKSIDNRNRMGYSIAIPRLLPFEGLQDLVHLHARS